jgi:hypothetical protein
MDIDMGGRCGVTMRVITCFSESALTTEITDGAA